MLFIREQGNNLGSSAAGELNFKHLDALMKEVSAMKASDKQAVIITYLHHLYKVPSIWHSSDSVASFMSFL